MSLEVDENVASKRHFLAKLRQLCADGPETLRVNLDSIYSPDAQWRGSHPMNEMTGIETIESSVWQPFFNAFPDVERRDTIVMGGEYEGRQYVAMTGHYCGIFQQDWLGIPPTHRPVYIRYGEVHQVKDGKIIQSNCLWDVLDVIRQSGFWPISPSTATETMWPGPLTADGLILQPTDPMESARSIAQTCAMHQCLWDYNDDGTRGRTGLINMPQRDHWHSKMMWYGPGGIGTTRGLEEFVDYHQLPFRQAFPRPRTQEETDAIAAEKLMRGGGHYIRVGDGHYSLTGGWPSRTDLHSGSGFLGLPATDKIIGMRVMDFYMHHEGLIRENWVPLDILDLLMQLGVDVLERMKPIFSRR